MIQELYQETIKFAGEKHSEQKVPGSKANYLLHLSNVAMELFIAYQIENNFDLNFAIQIAILHDTLEDTNTNFDELKINFGEPVALAVQALTKNKEIETQSGQMMDSLNRINHLSKEVGMVKIADRITNLQTPPNHWSENKILNYLKVSKMISNLLTDKNSYLHDRLEKKIKVYRRNVQEL